MDPKNYPKRNCNFLLTLLKECVNPERCSNGPSVFQTCIRSPAEQQDRFPLEIWTNLPSWQRDSLIPLYWFTEVELSYAAATECILQESDNSVICECIWVISESCLFHFYLLTFGPLDPSYGRNSRLTVHTVSLKTLSEIQKVSPPSWYW